MEILTPLEKNAYDLPNGVQFHVKHEGELEAGSFKQRGMVRAVESHPEENVFCLASAGGAAAALALAVQRAGKQAEVFVPDTTPAAKIRVIRHFGGDSVRIHQIEASFPEVQREAARYADHHNYRLQSAFDDADVIKGHGDPAREVIFETSNAQTRTHFVPVGGGSILAGTLRATEASGDRVVAVQFSSNTSLTESLAAQEQRAAAALDTLAEGSAANIGHSNFEIIQKNSDRLEVITVTRRQLGQMVLREAERHYQMYEAPYFPNNFESPYRRPEATGLIAEAGAYQYALTHDPVFGEDWIAYQTGANADEMRLRQLADEARDTALSAKTRTWHGPHTKF